MSTRGLYVRIILACLTVYVIFSAFCDMSDRLALYVRDSVLQNQNMCTLYMQVKWRTCNCSRWQNKIWESIFQCAGL